MLLFLISLASLIGNGLKEDALDLIWWIANAALFSYLFLFFQMIILTLLAVYYLGDKIHRKAEVSGNDLLRQIEGSKEGDK